MTTLFTAMLELARMLPDSFESVATGGSATTVIDAVNTRPNDAWNNGTLFFTGTLRAGTSVIPTDWVLLTNTLTIPTGAAVVAGTPYLLVPPRWPKADLLRALNVAILRQPLIAVDASLAPIASTLEYTLPAGVSNVLKVEIGTIANGWEVHQHWREVGGKLVFYKYEPSDTTAKIQVHYYPAQHAVLTEATTNLDGQLDIELLLLDAYSVLFEKWAATVRNLEPFEKDLFKIYEQKAMLRRQGKTRPQRLARLA